MRTVSSHRSRSIGPSGLPGVLLAALVVACSPDPVESAPATPSAISVTKPSEPVSGLRVGHVELPNTGAPAAQPDFLQGLAALHSFWYEEAEEAFLRAEEIDPGFALAYWGEAMSHYRALWSGVGGYGGRQALAKLDEHAAERLERHGTSVERALVAAARKLFDEGSGAGEKAFSDALHRAHERLPENVEIALFYALSLQGRAVRRGRRSERDWELIGESAAILERLFESHPEHPGVLHYLIHAYDDPQHAALGLKAARLYSDVAPDASHALHMPSHIFVQLGDWDGVVESNRRAWAASERWVERRDLPTSEKDFHALSWLHYGLLQQGRFDEAEEVLDTLRANRGQSHADVAALEARQVIESEDWDREIPDFSSRDNVVFARAYAAARRGDLSAAREGLEDFGALEISGRALEGFLAYREGRSERALELLREAAEREEKTRTPSGPPDLVKPALELYGEVLLELGRCEEAVGVFERSLARMPGRRLSVRGARRAVECS